jgi:hypothetical protein
MHVIIVESLEGQLSRAIKRRRKELSPENCHNLSWPKISPLLPLADLVRLTFPPLSFFQCRGPNMLFLISPEDLCPSIFID